MVDYNFCVQTPSWPGCDQVIADHEAAQKQDSGDMDMGKDDAWMEGSDPMAGQMTYTMVAVGAFANALLRVTRYEDAYDYSTYDDTIGDYNWIEIYHQIVDYSTIALMGVVSVTQVASLFGALGYWNIMAWGWSAFIMMFTGLVVEILMWYARDQASEEGAAAAWTKVESDWT